MYSSDAVLLRVLTATDFAGRKMVAKGRVKPSSIIAVMQMIQPVTMYGLRRPKRDLDLSARTPGTQGRAKAVSIDSVRTYEGLDEESRDRPREEDHCDRGLGETEGQEVGRALHGHECDRSVEDGRELRTVGHLHGPKDLHSQQANCDSWQLRPSRPQDLGYAGKMGILAFAALFSKRDGREAGHDGM